MSGARRLSVSQRDALRLLGLRGRVAVLDVAGHGHIPRPTADALVRAGLVRIEARRESRRLMKTATLTSEGVTMLAALVTVQEGAG